MGYLTLIAAVTLMPPAVKEPLFESAENGTYFVGPMPGRPVAGDVNNDGKMDVVVACGPCCGSPEQKESGHMFVLLGSGNGKFSNAGPPFKIAPSVRKVALGDLNGDGYLDAALAEHNTHNVRILLGKGNGFFTYAPGSPVNAGGGANGRFHCHEITIADVNGDGKKDVLTTLPNDHAVAVLLGNGKGKVTPAKGSPFQVASHPYDALIAADANNDGKMDLILPDMVANRVRVLFGNGAGVYSRENATVIEVGERPGYVATGDINGDGNMDICATHDDVSTVDLILGDGKGGFKPAANSPLKVETGPYVWGTELEDLNGDTKLDLVMGVAGGNSVVVMLGDGRGAFHPAIGSPYRTGNSSEYVAVADFNGDKKPDIVASNYKGSTLSILLNRG